MNVQAFRHGVAKEGGKSTLRNSTTHVEDKTVFSDGAKLMDGE